jgi:hypothetical protein
MKESVRATLAVVAATAGAVAVGVSILVLWSGQPGPDALDTDVLAYYRTNAGRIRAGDLLWTAGLLAMVGAVALVRRRFARGPRRVFLGGLAVCGAILVCSAAVAWFLAGDAASGAVEAPRAFERWSLEGSLFDGASFILGVPIVGAAVGLDRDRRSGVTMTVAGVVAAVLVMMPFEPWDFLAAVAWIAGAVAFTAHRPRPRTELRGLHPLPRPAVAA